jgi:hypothetical protein
VVEAVEADYAVAVPLVNLAVVAVEAAPSFVVYLTRQNLALLYLSRRVMVALAALLQQSMAAMDLTAVTQLDQTSAVVAF